MSVRKSRNLGSSQSTVSEHIQRATTRIYNEAISDPSLVVSPYINAWLEEHSRVYMHDPTITCIVIIDRVHQQHFFLSLFTRPAYGKSDLFHAKKDSIINFLSVRQGLEAYGRSNKRRRKINVKMPDLTDFADEFIMIVWLEEYSCVRADMW
ncbi:hypothetical protein I4U23_017007 [Adineta vaga]|nr:hypothetical protein I4U23_017007 [Adineta vaga]